MSCSHVKWHYAVSQSGATPKKIINVGKCGDPFFFEHPNDESGDVLAAEGCPPQAEGQAEIYEVSALWY